MRSDHPLSVLKNSTAADIAIWTPPPGCSLPSMVGASWKRVNEWLEEVGYLREGVKLIGGGTNFSFEQVVQSSDADGASLNTSTTESALATTPGFLGSGTGVQSAGFFMPGKTLRLSFVAALSSLSATPGNFNLNLRQDSTTGATAGAQVAYALATSLSASPVELEALLVCRADGTAGNVETIVKYAVGLTPSGTTLPFGQTSLDLRRTNIGSFDTTGNRSFMVTGLFSVSSASNIALSKIFVVEVLN